MTLTLFSDDFVRGDIIPVRHTCEGSNISPALTWGDPPDGTRSFALICDDPDTPRGTFVHWVLFNLPPNVRGLAQNVQKVETLSDGSRQGTNDFGKPGYGGPCPPPGHGPHRYFFKLYALDTLLELPSNVTKAEVVEAMDGHILAQGEVMGRFERRERR